MKTKTVTGLSYWASAIINLDYSGLERADNDLSFSDCLTCSDQYIGRIADVCDYIFTA